LELELSDDISSEKMRTISQESKFYRANSVKLVGNSSVFSLNIWTICTDNDCRLHESNRADILWYKIPSEIAGSSSYSRAIACPNLCTVFVAFICQ
jgi:hypothetical protein